jgi:cytochrome c551/c552
MTSARIPRTRSAGRPWATLLLLAAFPSSPALADEELSGSALALQMGCYNCHGKHPRHDAPTMAQLAEHAAKHRGESGAAAKEAQELRRGEPFRRIVAHEQLSAETAEKLMQWIIDGAKPTGNP